jgi:hypothetical protein
MKKFVGKGDRFIFSAVLLTAANVREINLSPFYFLLLVITGGKECWQCRVLLGLKAVNPTRSAGRYGEEGSVFRVSIPELFHIKFHCVCQLFKGFCSEVFFIFFHLRKGGLADAGFTGHLGLCKPQMNTPGFHKIHALFYDTSDNFMGNGGIV